MDFHRVTCPSPRSLHRACPGVAVGAHPVSLDLVCPIREPTIELRGLFFGFLSRHENRLKHGIRIKHSLQLFAVEEVAPHLIVFAGDVIKPAFGLGEVV